MFLIIIATIASLGLAIYAWQHRLMTGARPLLGLCLAVAVWSCGYAIELTLTELTAIYFWAKIQYFGIVTAPLAWFYLSLEYTGRDHWLSRRIFILTSIIPIITLIFVWVYDSLIWQTASLETAGSYLLFSPTYGFWFWVYFAYSYSLLIAGTILLAHTAVRSFSLYRWQAIFLLLVSFFPWLGNLLYILDYSQIDLTPFAFVISVFIFAWSVFRLNLLDIFPMANYTIINNMSDGVIVLDLQNRVVNINPAAQKAMGLSAQTVIGQPIIQSLAGTSYAALAESFEDIYEARTEIAFGEDEAQHVYDFQISPIFEQRQQHLKGRIIAFREITQLKAVEKDLSQTISRANELAAAATALQDSAAALNSTLNLNDVLHNILHSLGKVMTHDGVNIMLLRQNDHIQIMRYLEPEQGTIRPEDWQLCVTDLPLLQVMLTTREPLVVSDTSQDSRWVHIQSDDWVCSYAGAPIIIQNDVAGFLNVNSRLPGFFSVEQGERLQAFANQAAIAIQNARLHTRMQQRARELTILLQTATAVSSTLDLEEVLATIAEYMIAAINFTDCTIWLWNQDKHEISTWIEKREKTTGFLLKPGLKYALADYPARCQVLEKKSPLILNISDPDIDSAEIQVMQNHDVLSLLMLPLIASNRVIGLIELHDEKKEREFSADEVRFCTVLADQAAMAIENARLYDQAQRELTERERIQKDLQISEERYRDLFDNASDLIQSVGENGRLLYVNQRWLDTLEYTPEEVSQMEFVDVVHPDFREHCAEIFHRLRTKESVVKMETIFISKKGEPFVVEGNLNAQYEDGRFVAARGFFRDITERKAAEEALRDNEEWLHAILASMDDLVFVLDKQGIFVDYYQPKEQERLYALSEQFLNRSYEEVLPPPVVEGLGPILKEIDKAGQVKSFEYSLTPGDQTLWFNANISGRNGRNGQFDGVTIVVRDITDYKQTAEQLRRLAMHDNLTGLPNRMLLMEQLNQAIAQKANRHFALLFLDLDRFKIINDSLGHQIGDALLVAIARVLEGCVRQHDMVARLGGDEFVVLLSNVGGEVEAQRVAERILNRMSQPFFLDGHTIHTSASIGLISRTKHYEYAEDVLRHADMAMYQAKLGGKARYELFDLSQQDEAADMWQIENDLRRALEHEELVVYYQPIISLASGRVTSIEALVRWQHPQRGLLDPAVFLPIAEEAGLIAAINEWVLEQACQQLSQWHQKGFETLCLNVNTSAVQLQQEHATDFIQDTLRQAGLPLHILGLEITERFSSRTSEHLPVLIALHDLGVRVLIDDFGIGSSLEALKLFPLDCLKINQTFVQGMTRDASDRAIITAMIAMAHSLGLKVVAEGVETMEQLAYLRAEGCDEIQGFFLTPPLPAFVITEWLQENRRSTLGIESPSKMLDLAVRAHFADNIGYALVDEQLLILKNNETMQRWMTEHAERLEGLLVTEAFPVFIGLEEPLLAMVHDPLAEPIILSRVYCPGADEFGRYYDLRIGPFAADTTVLLLIVQDVTRQAQEEFALRQQLNELRLTVNS